MAAHPLNTTSNIVLSKSRMRNTKNRHLSNIDMSTHLKSCESSYSECSVMIINVIWKSAHSIITFHSPSSHKITISSHPNSLKSCAMAQIWMLHDDPSASTTSSSSQTTFSSWSIYHHAMLTSGLTISDSTLSDQGNDGKKRQWYYSIQRRIRMVRLYNGTRGWCHVMIKMGRSSSLQSQDMDMDTVLLWSKGEMGHSLEFSKPIS